LRLSSGTVQKELFWEGGVVIYSKSNDPQDYLGQYLLGQGLITEDDLNMALKTQQETNSLLGSIFIMVGLITPDQMEAVLTRKAETSIFEMFLWDEGSWEVDTRLSPPADIVRIGLTPGKVIDEGRRRRERWLAMQRAIPSSDHRFDLNPERIPLEALSDFDLSVYFDMVQEGRTVREMSLETHRPEFVIMESLYDLIQKGYISLAGKKAPALPERKETGGVSILLVRGEESLMGGRYQDAASAYRSALEKQPDSDEARLGLQRAQAELGKEIKARIEPHRVPDLAVSMAELMKRKLTPEEGYLLSRINGVWDIRSIISVSPLKEADALLLIKNLLDQGLIRLK
jgi:hypothetical protein